MGKRQPSSTCLTSGASCVTACIFRTPWGWMGVSETTKGIDAVVLPKASRQAVLSELAGLLSAELLEGRTSPRLREAQAQLTELSGRNTQVLRSAAGPLTRDEFSAEGLANPSTHLLRPASILSMGGCPCWGQTVARAVGNAVGANPMPIVIPCHRIVAQDASLGGFSCGLPMKRKLLTLEGTLAELRPGRS